MSFPTKRINPEMHVCLISVEIFAWGKYGGFGRATRIIGRELVRRGVQVTAVVPQRKGQSPVENLDGIRVIGFKPSRLISAIDLFREANADIYHSEEPSLGTFFAMQAMPDRKHIITFRDTRDAQDWRTEFSLPSLNPVQVIANWLYEDNWFVRNAVRKANAHFAAAYLLIPKARLKYHLSNDPVFLPTPVYIPGNIQKASVPTVCFISRWDRRKRPEIFFELARVFPQVRFIAAGKSRDQQWDNYLRSKYKDLPNLEMVGFLDQFQSDELSRFLSQSWIMVNTAAREGLPNAFIEAAAHRCAILSAVDPDGFASQFGYHANEDEFEEGLRILLEKNHWMDCAQKGYDHVVKTFACDSAINQHLSVYRRICSTAEVS
jgi:glycosyltransferase involved in cell wall biosynthesis